MGLQLLQNTEIIKQTDFGKFEENTDPSCIYLCVIKECQIVFLILEYNLLGFLQWKLLLWLIMA